METFWSFRLRFRRAYDSAYDTDFRFSLGHKLSYDSDYDSDSDSVASENQPLEVRIFLRVKANHKTARNWIFEWQYVTFTLPQFPPCFTPSIVGINNCSAYRHYNLNKLKAWHYLVKMDLTRVAIIHECDNNFSFFYLFALPLISALTVKISLRKIEKIVVFSSVSCACKMVQIYWSIHKC